jgi:geranylgeranyl pyrophosphate synthase
LGEIIFLVGGGQFLDSEATFEPFDAVDCIKVARYKTASYSFVGPLSMGATLAGAKGSDLERIQTYGENIGIAFQLMDDILGIFGDEQTLGKSTTGDIKEGKRTLLMQYALAHGDSKTTNRLQSLLGNNKVTARDTETVKLILEATGAKQYVLEQVQLYKQSALAALRETSLSTDIQAELITIAEKATNRVS